MIPPRIIECMLNTARSAADERGIAVCIGVTDISGAMCGFLRMPGAFLVSSELSIDKAWTAAGMGMSTRELGNALRTMSDPVREGLLRRPRLTEVPGGMPVMHDMQCLGAIGVSGGIDVQDEEIAIAAVAAAEKMLDAYV